MSRSSRFRSGTTAGSETTTGTRTAQASAQTGDQSSASETDESETADNDQWADTYDNHFRKYTKRYFSADYDWRWFKAQAIVESTLNPRARSSSGAVGLMQIKPKTFRDIRKEHPEIRNLHSPRWNIAAGICYVRRLYDKSDLKILPDRPRLFLAFASYNVGYTRMLKVMRRTPPESKGWHDTLSHSPLEARDYVKRIIEVKTEI
ncbi:MAG: transglycosylase SLT domain-containing protein [Stenotrophobium sp.]